MLLVKFAFKIDISVFLSCFEALFFSLGGKLWWADDVLAQLGTINKRDGKNLTVLRNETTGVIHIKVYDKDSQKGKKKHIPQCFV